MVISDDGRWSEVVHNARDNALLNHVSLLGWNLGPTYQLGLIGRAKARGTAGMVAPHFSD
jgi:hypothetical protein